MMTSSFQSSESLKKSKRLHVVGVCSGKGGVGKTCIAVNLAVIAAQRGERVLVLDADLGLANVEILLGLRPRYHIGDVLHGKVSVREAVIEGPNGMHVLSGSSGVKELATLDASSQQNLVNALEMIEDDYDLLIVDSGAGIGENVRFFMGACHDRLLVVNTEPTSFADAYATVKVLSEAGIKSIEVILNSVRGEAEARAVFNSLSEVVSRHLPTRLVYLGAIPHDESVGWSVAAQRPVAIGAPGSAASRALSDIAERIIGAQPLSILDGGLKFLWRRLLRESTG